MRWCEVWVSVDCWRQIKKYYCGAGGTWSNKQHKRKEKNHLEIHFVKIYAQFFFSFQIHNKSQSLQSGRRIYCATNKTQLNEYLYPIRRFALNSYLEMCTRVGYESDGTKEKKYQSLMRRTFPLLLLNR